MRDSLTVACTRSILRSVRAFTRESLERLDMDEITVNMLVLAVDEVCSNLIIHAHFCNPNHAITLAIYTAGTELVFDIKDEGTLFDFSNYMEPKIEDLKRTERKGGMGLMLVNRIMDRIEFHSDGPVNICRLVKKLR
jgi:serine/threonine-protein kinase RsbW